MAFLSIKQVAERYGVSYRRVRYAIRKGRIKALRIDWVWLVDEKDLPERWPGGEREELNAHRSAKSSMGR